MPLAIVKLGGSLMGDPALNGLLSAICDAGSAVIVPGGGAFADGVREAQRRLDFSDGLAHRLALEAMRAFGLALVERDPRLALAGRNGFAALVDDGHVPVWDASELSGHRDIPESWNITSDSLSAWLAAEIQARTLVIVKSTSPADPAEDLLDAAFPEFAARLPAPARIVGPDPIALAQALARGRDGAASWPLADDHHD